MASQSLPNRQSITFLTDFGLRDTYVGQMKGVALGINPEAQLVDLTHEIPTQQILRGAFLWSDAAETFPAGTIHVGSVGVTEGPDLRLIAAEIGAHRFICPDNGLLSVILARGPLHRVVELDHPGWWRSSKFNPLHGRDILAPVAAAWSAGHDLLELGSEYTQSLVTLPRAQVQRGKSSLSGLVVDIDHWGNAITNIDALLIPDQFTMLIVEVGSLRISGLARSYSDIVPDEPVALIGSSGRLEISIPGGNAADELQLDYGRSITVRWTGSAV